MRAVFLIPLLMLAASPAFAQESLLKREPSPLPPFDIRPAEEALDAQRDCIRRRGALTLAVLDFCNTGRAIVTMNGRRLLEAPPPEILSKGRVDRQPDGKTGPEPDQ